MESVFSQIGPWIFFLTLGSGMGVPLGIPPAPDDPVMARFAPEECVFYTTWSASAAAESREQEPGRADAGRAGSPAVRRAFRKVDPATPLRPAGQRARREQPLRRDFDAMLLILRHQTTLFVSDLKIKDKKVSAKGGMVVALGADAAGATRLFHAECPRVLSQSQRGIGGGGSHRRPEMVSREAQSRVPHDDGGDQGFLLDCGGGRRNARHDPPADAEAGARVAA